MFLEIRISLKSKISLEGNKMNVTLLSAYYDAGKYRKGENLGIKAIETVLCAQGHNVYIYDMNFTNISVEDLISQIKNNGSNIVGFSVSFTFQIYETIKLAKGMREKLKNVHFTIGGQGVSFIIPHVLEDNKEFDSGICFEGEMTFLELIECLQEKREFTNIKGLYYRIGETIGFNGNRNPIENLDILPYMIRNRQSDNNELTHVSMITSRGCTGRCLFCSSGYFSNRYHNLKKWRFRSANNILGEIENIKSNSEKLAISFVDDNFLGGNQEGYNRARCFSEELIKRRININWSMECRVDDVNYELFNLMRKAGLKNVFLGVESGNEEDLKLFNKQITLSQIANAVKILEDLELTYDIGFIMFHPTSTIRQLIVNANFLKKYNCANSKNLSNELSLYHGSPLVKYYEARQLIKYEKYTIIQYFEDQNIKTILSYTKQLLNSLSEVEVKLDRILFDIQNGTINADASDEYKKYLTLKKELSNFEADFFIEICKEFAKADSYLILKERIENYRKNFIIKMNNIGGGL